MAIIEIVTFPAPILDKPANIVENIDKGVVSLIDDMKETLYDAPGIGLAAVQVGYDKSIIIYDLTEEEEAPGSRLKVLINPRIVNTEGKFNSENEGCLSVPGLRADVPRHACVTVEGVDIDGKPVKIDAEGMESIVLQHEIDHLNGVLFINRISALKRNMYKKKVLKALKAEGNN